MLRGRYNIEKFIDCWHDKEFSLGIYSKVLKCYTLMECDKW